MMVRHSQSCRRAQWAMNTASQEFSQKYVNLSSQKENRHDGTGGIKHGEKVITDQLHGNKQAV